MWVNCCFCGDFVLRSDTTDVKQTPSGPYFLETCIYLICG